MMADKSVDTVVMVGRAERAKAHRVLTAIKEEAEADKKAAMAEAKAIAAPTAVPVPAYAQVVSWDTFDNKFSKEYPKDSILADEDDVAEATPAPQRRTWREFFASIFGTKSTPTPTPTTAPTPAPTPTPTTAPTPTPAPQRRTWREFFASIFGTKSTSTPATVAVSVAEAGAGDKSDKRDMDTTETVAGATPAWDPHSYATGADSVGTGTGDKRDMAATAPEAGARAPNWNPHSYATSDRADVSIEREVSNRILDLSQVNTKGTHTVRSG